MAAILKADILAALNASFGRTEAAAAIDLHIKATVVDISKKIDALSLVHTITTEAGEGAYDLPADFKGIIDVRDPEGKLEKSFLDTLLDHSSVLPRTRPDSWVIDGGKLRVCPVPDGEYTITLRYYGIHADTADTIAYSLKYKDVVTWGTLWRFALAKTLREDAAVYLGMYNDEIDVLNGLEPKKARRTQYCDL